MLPLVVGAYARIEEDLMAVRAAVRSQRALGAELARLRYDRGLTQQELVEELGITRRYLTRLSPGS